MLLPRSATKTPPRESTASAQGRFNNALAPIPPSPLKPAALPPAIVAIVPSGPTSLALLSREGPDPGHGRDESDLVSYGAQCAAKLKRSQALSAFSKARCKQ